MPLSWLIQNRISHAFSCLFFLIPLILAPLTSELFEFNKIILLYFSTLVIVFLWLSRMLIENRFIFRRTTLDIPLVLFLLSQVISTIFSIDPHTSIFGYYSRFNGGLLSTISYLLLYWSFVSNVDLSEKIPNSKQKYFSSFILPLLVSAFLVSLYGLAQRLGLDAHIWVQDVKSRVFSTLGQPNWLAAYLTALIFIPVAQLFKPGQKHISLALYFCTLIFFICLLFTKSRSGLLAFSIGNAVFWTLIIFSKIKNWLKLLLIFNFLFFILAFIFGTPWTPSLFSFIPSKQASTPPAPQPADLLISESGDIRKVVWGGALALWFAKPVFGTGVETFAYTYPWVKPVEHNLLSEWDFTYNKAHNQFLNYAATTGSFGLGTYLFLIVAIGWLFIKASTGKHGRTTFVIACAAGWFTILVTDFFGFSVVAVDLLFFLLPALAMSTSSPVSITESQASNPKNLPSRLTRAQTISLVVLSLALLFSLTLPSRAWLADYHYAKAKKLGKSPISLNNALNEINLSVQYFPGEPVYRNELSSIAANLALEKAKTGNTKEAIDLIRQSLLASQAAVTISPYNQAFLRSRAQILHSLTGLNPDFLPLAIETLEAALSLSPTDPKLYYNLGLLELARNNTDKSLQYLSQAIELKPNYQDPLLAMAIIYENRAQKDKAREYYQKLLKINPAHPSALEKLSP